jgi:hypothetical protein
LPPPPPPPPRPNPRRYYNDLWQLDLEELEWTPLGNPTDKGPSPRSACPMLVYGDTLFLYGGYFR